MYSLLIGGEPEGENNEETFILSRGRFLEYTSESLAVQFKALSTEARACLMSWPCLRMQEGRGQERAHVGQISRIDVTGPDIAVTLQLFQSQPPLSNDAIWRERTPLDIEQFEFSRNHWAIKDRALFPPLSHVGITFDPAVIARFADIPIPAPSRPELLRARDVVSNWTQTDIDDFLLEAGVEGLVVPRAVGSRRDRANTIITFALNNPASVTAENSLFSAFIVRKAAGGSVDGQVAVQPPSAPQIPLPRSDEPQPERSDRSPNRVFVVHGQNEEARSKVVSFLDRHGLLAIVLHEQPNMGRHLLTKFIDEAELVTFAIVLMTDDDVGGRRESRMAPRARQNVILELGYFLSHLRQERVCALITPGLETPSDFDGIVYISMDENGHWQTELLRELHAARMPVREH